MSEHVSDWLGAFLDGELYIVQRREVENHLAECKACQSEVESLRRLSTLLRRTPTVRKLMPTKQFVAMLNLKLPRRVEASSTRKGLQAAWWLVPAAVLGVWVCLQIASVLTAFVSTASQADLLGTESAWLQVAPQQSSGLVTTVEVFGGQLSASYPVALEVLKRVDQFLQGWIAQMTWRLALSVLYWGWLAVWWLRRRQQGAQKMWTT